LREDNGLLIENYNITGPQMMSVIAEMQKAADMGMADISVLLFPRQC
jgi:hypothetical protein